MSFNLSQLYNNKQDSDIRINLSTNKCIHAHKVILRQVSPDLVSMLEQNMYFIPQASNAAVRFLMLHIYNHTKCKLYTESMEDPAIWAGTLRLCIKYVINYDSFLAGPVPKNIKYASLVELASLTSSEKLMTEAINRINNSALTRFQDDPLFEDKLPLIDGTYNELRAAWKRAGRDQYHLLMLDCYHHQHGSTAFQLDLINSFIAEYPLSNFTQAQLICIKQFPIFSTVPLLIALMETQ